MDLKLDGLRGLVTGSSSGVGAVIAPSGSRSRAVR